MRARQMRGGHSSAVHALTIEDAAGLVHRVVLRRFTDTAWLAREPDLAAREATALRVLARTDIPVPRLLAVDPAGRRAGVPAVLMTRCPGHLDLRPGGPALEAIAALLPRIHATRLRGVHLPPYARYRPEPDRVPSWSRDPNAWRALIERARRRAPPFEPTFIHRDFHPANLLWSRARISAVVDWVNASIGPALVDLAHCRWNLAVLEGPRAADALLAAYRRLVPTEASHDPYWDILTLLDSGLPDDLDLAPWHAAGRPDLTRALVRRRLDAYAATLADLV